MPEPVQFPGWRLPCRLLLALALFLCLGGPGPAWAASQDKLEILFLSSFGKDPPAQKAIERGLDRELGFQDGRNDIYFEFIDSPRLPLDSTLVGLHDLIVQKYKGKRFDAVVAWAMPAARLVARLGTFLGPDTPILFLEVTDQDIAALGLARSRNYSIEVKNDYKTSLADALRLSQARRVAVVGEASTPLGRDRVGQFRQAMAAIGGDIPVDELFDLPLDEVLSRTANLPPETMIYYLLMFSDGKGTHLAPFEVARRINQTANAPMFTQWESLLGSGVVGGYQLSQEVVGQNIGQGVRLASLGQPFTPAHGMRYAYDWPRVKKWGWDDKSRLQSEAILLNRPPDLLDEYRWHIFSTAVFVVLLMILALSLARALHGRNQAVLELADERENLAQRVDERTAELARSNQELESFAYAISHDLRAPMRTINGFAGLLDKRFHELLSGEGVEFLDQIKSGAVQMDAMIMGLLEYSRVGHQSPDKFRTADIAAIADEAAALLRNEAEAVGGRLDVNAKGGPIGLRCNGDLIHRLFQNLIENAIKYRSPERALRISVDISKSEAGIKATVQDNGIGIPKGRRERVFKIFQRDAPASVPGYGIGLSLCQRIVQAHGGDIWIEDNVPEGSRFCFTLKEVA
ncbi:MAG: ATP-binding protein [Rhodospirillales bacterium]